MAKSDKKLSEKVYEHDFQAKSFGYDARQVDSFLDELNVDIEKLESKLQEQEKEIKHLKSEVDNYISKINQLTKALASAKASDLADNKSSASGMNLEMIKRISNLEEMVNKILIKLSDD